MDNTSLMDYTSQQISEMKGIVYDIQRWAIHDGPGIRTIVFLKGCPLTCIWCDNPESQKQDPQIAFFPDKCVQCERCLKECPLLALKITDNGNVETNLERCQECQTFDCAKACKTNARVVIGRYYTVDEIVNEALKDRLFYQNSNGGITISGGEPLNQPEFTWSILKRSKGNDIYPMHTAMETSGFGKWEFLMKILEYVDFLFFDLKHIDPRIHREWTGCPNELILENLIKTNEYVKKHSIDMVIRVPLIRGFNDSTTDITGIVEFVENELPEVNVIEILPYHRLGRSKYKSIGRKYALWEEEPVKDSYTKKFKEIVRKYGFKTEWE